MKIHLSILNLIFILLLSYASYSQQEISADNSFLPYKKQYFASEFEIMSFSSAISQNPQRESHLSTMRFSGFFNYGYYYHRNFTESFGFYTGLSIRNVGFINKYNNPDSTVKHRTYSLNVPIRLKIGNMGANQYFFIGGEIGIPFHYKEKSFLKGDRYNKKKINDWFDTDGRVNLFQPSVTIGYQKGMSYIRLYYYPLNFFNKEYSSDMGEKYYHSHNANIFGVAMGIHISNRPLYD